MTFRPCHRHFLLPHGCLPAVRGMLLAVSIGLMLMACTDDDAPSPLTHRIAGIVSASGIGDQGYVDRIVIGYERVYFGLAPSAHMQIYTPRSVDEAYDISLLNVAKAKDGVPTLIILGSAEFLPVADSLLSDRSLSGSNVSVLLFEVDSLAPALNDLHFHTFSISTYQACHEAGQYVAEEGFERPLIWLANPGDWQLDSFRDGFSNGYFSVKGTRPDVKCLVAADYSGYNLSDSAYRAMPELSEKYDFLFPVMGGSNLGIFRYLRENPDGPHVAGMDVDQSQYANNIEGSVIKHIDQAIVDFTNDWMAGERIPSHASYDVTSGYAEWYVPRR